MHCPQDDTLAMKSVPLRLIAAKLACSRSTVSYALRNRPCISAAMREKVQKLARELGWQPDANLARQLALVRATGRRDRPNLALVLNKPRRELAEQHAPRKHLEGAIQRARDLGYNLEVFNIAEARLSPARLHGVLQARGIQGLVYLATTGQQTTLDQGYLNIGRHYACSVLGIRYPDPPFHVAIGNLYSSGQLAVKELLKAGFRRPGAVLPRGLDRLLAWSFGGGIQAGFLELPPENRIPICYVGQNENYLPESSFPEIRDWLVREQPDVLVTTDLDYERRLLAHLDPSRQAIRVCALDYHEGVARDFGVDQCNEEVGAAAIDLVVAQLHRGERGIPAIQRTIQIEGHWVGEVAASGSARNQLAAVSAG